MTCPVDAAVSLRGQMHRSGRLMDDAAARTFLRGQKVAHVATVGADGWPYVVPLIYVYEGGDVLYVHTGDHLGHFQRNVRASPRVCTEVAEMGPVHRGRTYACQSSLVFTSVIVFGAMTIIEDDERKAWFFDCVMEKYGAPEWSFEPGYPLLHRIVLFEQRLEVITGKQSHGHGH